MKDFDNAVMALPENVSFHPLKHRTLEDLCVICISELEKMLSNEIWLDISERLNLRKFIKKHGAGVLGGYYVREAQSIYRCINRIEAVNSYGRY